MRILVGLGTCGVAAGAEATYAAIVEKTRPLNGSCKVEKTGCIGMCYREPLVELREDDGTRWQYGQMTPDRVDRLLEEHVGKGEPIEDWLVWSSDGKGPGEGLPRPPAPHRAAQLRGDRPGEDRAVPRGGRVQGPGGRPRPRRTPTASSTRSSSRGCAGAAERASSPG